MGDNLSPLFGWRSAIASSSLDPPSRHLALTLSLYMSERGDSAWPSVATLVSDTGLSERTVQVHLGKLIKGGWLTSTPRKLPDGSRTSNLYTAAIPGAPAAGGGASPAGGVVQLTAFGGASPAPNCVNNTPYEDVPALFARFYAIYPLKKAPQKARQAFQRALRLASPEQIIAGAERYRDDPTRKPEFTAHPATWLNAGRWDDEYVTPDAPRLARRW
jgi:hypothetical protein